jgi:putative Holliday junction resolvase
MKRPEPTARIATSRVRPRVLAVDYGRRWLGLAVSDALGLTAKPLVTLERKNRREDVRRLRALVREHEVGQIVVGCPFHLDGRKSDMAVEAARFARRLKRELGLPVELADERLTSWEAAQISAEHRGRKRRRRTHDELAAAILLRDYLERQRARQQGI